MRPPGAPPPTPTGAAAATPGAAAATANAATAVLGPLEAKAHIVAGNPYGNAVDRLKALQAEGRACGTKREQADRDMESDVRRAFAADRSTADGPGALHVVIVSTDGDFIPCVKQLVESGVRVTVVHAAVAGSEHFVALRQFATALVDVSDFAPRGGPAEGAAAPVRAPPAQRQPQPQPQAGPARITVNGEVVAVTALQRNFGFSRLQAVPGREGVWCNNTNAGHNAMTCKFMHRVPAAATPEQHRPQQQQAAPARITVNGQLVAVTAVLRNAGLARLLDDASLEGFWCNNTTVGHNAMTCKFMHRVPAAATPEQHRPQQHQAAPARITVNGQLVAVTALQRNAGLARLQAVPGREGVRCNNTTVGHNALTCKFIHFN